MAGTSNSITTHNILNGVLNADNVISGLVNTAFNPAYALVTQTGAQIALFINNNDYKMYAQLKDKSGNLIYTSNIIDLPLETMVVDGRYDSNTKKLILVLDNGNEIEVPLEALINGLVNEDDLIANYYGKDEIDALLDGYWTKIELTQEDIDNWNAANAAFESELFDDGVISIEDSTEANINNTMNKSQLKIGLKGNTSQFSTTGKNLWGGFTFTKTNSGITFTYNTDGTITANGTSTGTALSMTSGDAINYLTTLSAGTYTISGGTSNVYLHVCNSAGGILANTNGNSSVSFTLSEDTNIFVRARIGGNITVNNVTVYQMLETGSTASDYEPYTNGASPNPDYPQDIQVVSGDNTIKVEGKNLLDTSSMVMGDLPNDTGIEIANTNHTHYMSEFIKVLPNTQYTFTTNYTYPSNSVTKLMEYANDKSFIQRNSSSSSNKIITFTTNSNTYYLRICMYSSTAFTDFYSLENMLTKGNDTTYEEYKEQSYEINLGDIELCKIGDYQDYIRKSTGKNLFDKNSANIIQNKYLNDSGVEMSDNNFSISDYIKVDANTVYSGQPHENKSACICFYNSSKTFLSSKRLTQINPNFTTPNNCEYIRASIWKADINILQIEKGTQATSYEPYGKVWYLNKQIGKVVLDGSESYGVNTKTDDFLRFAYNNSEIKIADDTITVFCKSDNFKGVPYSVLTRTNINQIGTSNNANRVFINISTQLIDATTSDTTTEIVNKFTTWLSTHNTTLYYVLETPTITEITDATLIGQLDNLENAYSYDTQTNITQTNDDMPFILDINAIADNVNGLKLENENQEYKTNKVIELSSNSTDDEYPSAKCVYDIVGNIEAVLAAMDSGSGV